ncbi:hypothetical protein FEM48_Zijuj05G0065000 [Ziziphus jujuba var. spinosa]|uniref:Uncharacterized protein n=1 Tax=Ziziphus jujuba var. spinosa TaxID=714518 RepID=A0A978VDC8_ZIZJJ|nr:hypothetical protein FEM48_Zijuj05G0065000 [Ziziphus jujuba var. spinosa]
MVNLSQMSISISHKVISRCVLGQKFEEDNNATRSGFGELSKNATVQLTAFSFGDYFPYLRWMDVVTCLVSSLKATFSNLDPILEKVIDDHKEALTDKDNFLITRRTSLIISSSFRKMVLLIWNSLMSNLKAILMRFENNQVDFKGLPFGVARRGCPSLTFAEDVLSLSTMDVTPHHMRIIGDTKVIPSMLIPSETSWIVYLDFERMSWSALSSPKTTSKELTSILGGSDTAWTSLEWLMSELMRNPKVIKKVHKERFARGNYGFVMRHAQKSTRYHD